jgi:hypothetical protein
MFSVKAIQENFIKVDKVRKVGLAEKGRRPVPIQSSGIDQSSSCA